MQKRQVIIAVILLIVGSVGVSFFADGAVADAWSMATTKKTDTFTALSFSNTGKLPTYSPVGTPQHATFSIANHESATTTYHYIALLGTGSSATVIDKGSVSLPVNQSAERTVTYRMPQADASATITIQLVDRTEYITFGTKS